MSEAAERRTLTTPRSVSSTSSSSATTTANNKVPVTPRTRPMATLPSSSSSTSRLTTTASSSSISSSSSATAPSSASSSSTSSSHPSTTATSATSTVSALMENKMSKMKDHLMKQKAKEDELKEKEYSETIQQHEKTISELSKKVASLTEKCLDGETQLRVVQEQFEMQLEELQLQLEGAHIDKELAEQELEDLRLSVSQQQQSLIEQVQSDVTGEMDRNQINELRMENAKMKQIVIAFRDMQQSEKQELERKNEQLATNEHTMKELQSKIEFHEKRIRQLEDTIKDLQEQILVAQSSEQMIESLTEKNLMLGERIAQLESQVKEHEEERALHSEVDRYNDELIKSLRDDLFKKEQEYIAWERELTLAKSVVKERDVALGKFRLKIAELTKELHTLRHSRDNDESQINEYKNRTNQLLTTYHNLQEKLKKITVSSVDQDIQSAVIRNNDELLNHIQQFLPDEVLHHDIKSVKTLRSINILRHKLETSIQVVSDLRNSNNNKNDNDNNLDSRDEIQDRNFEQESTLGGGLGEGKDSTSVTVNNGTDVSMERDFFIVHASFTLHLCLYMVDNFKIVHVSDVHQLTRLGKFYMDIMDVDESMDSLLAIVKTSEPTQQTMFPKLKSFVEQLGRLYIQTALPLQRQVGYGSLSLIVSAIVSLCQEGLELIGQIQVMSEDAIDDEERQSLPNNQLKHLSSLLKRGKEEYAQLVQTYRRLGRCLEGIRVVSIDSSHVKLVQRVISFGLVSYESLVKKHVRIQRVSQEKSWNLISVCYSRLSEALVDNVEMSDHHRSAQHLEDISLDNPLDLCTLILGIPEDTMTELCDTLGKSTEFVPSDLVQDMSRAVAALCEYVEQSKEALSDDTSDETRTVETRAQQVREKLSSVELLSKQLTESRTEINKLHEQRASMESRLEQVQHQKEEIEKSIQEHLSREREYTQMEQRLKEMEGVQQRLNEIKQKEVQYQNEISDLRFQIETLEQQNHVLQQQIGGGGSGGRSGQHLHHNHYSDLGLTNTSMHSDMSSIDHGNSRAIIDPIDRLELLSLRSAVHQMKQVRMAEQSQRNEQLLRNMLFNAENDVTRASTSAIWNQRYHRLQALASMARDLVKHRSCASIVDVTNIGQKGSIDNQCIKLRKRVLSVSHRISSPVLRNRAASPL